MGKVIRAEIDGLREVAQVFAHHADLSVALTFQVEALVDQLQGGAWRGVGAEAFYAEMRELILPAMRKLQDSLQFAHDSTLTIIEIMQAAEEEAAALFRGLPGGETTPPRQDDEERRKGLLAQIQLLMRTGGSPDDVCASIPELCDSDLDALNLAQLQNALEKLEQRALYLLLLKHLFTLYGKLDIPFPDSLERMTPEALRKFLYGDAAREAIALTFMRLLLWSFSDDLVLQQRIRDWFGNLSPEEQVDLLYSIALTMTDTPDYMLGDAVDADTLPIPEFHSLSGQASVSALALFTAVISTLRRQMARAAVDPILRTQLMSEWLAGNFGDDTWGDQILGLGDALAIGAVLPIVHKRLAHLGIEGEAAGNIEAILERLGGKQGKGFLDGVDDDTLKRLGVDLDPKLHTDIHDRLTKLRSLTPEERAKMGFNQLEADNPNFHLYRTDVEVGDLAGTGIVYGSTRNLNKGTDLAFEYTAAGKPDPTLAVHVPLGQGKSYVEFDWYTVNDKGQIVLIDAKNIGKGASAYDFREGSTFSSTSWGKDAQKEIMADAHKQSKAAEKVGASVEWRVPAGTPDEVVEALQESIRGERITNINVVKIEPNTP